jgi:hypothetical protein
MKTSRHDLIRSRGIESETMLKGRPRTNELLDIVVLQTSSTSTP